MSKNILLAVDAASHDPVRHVAAAADMTRELSQDSGDHVIVLHVHEFATGRFGRIRVDCGDGEGEGVVDKIVSDLQAAGVSAEGEIREANLGHIARRHLARGAGPRRAAGRARLQQPDRPAPYSAGQRGQPAAAHGHPAGPDRAQDGPPRRVGRYGDGSSAAG